MAEWDAVADSYEETLEPTTAGFAPRYLELIGASVVDVGAGPGVVSMTAAGAGVDVFATDLSAAMIEQLAARADRTGLSERVRAFVADAQCLPLRDASVDSAVSNFGIIFCPDVGAALREMNRVARHSVAFTAWTSETRNGWTFLLEDGYAARLGFGLSMRPMFKWSSIDELRGACTDAGLANVDVDTSSALPTTYPSWHQVGEALERPATKEAIASLNAEQVSALGAYLELRAREVFGEAEVVLPREAWFAHATPS